ncbi:MAG: hypothetical protein M3Q93_07540 [Gemmatimonadota bacterium]|nr:hypothetical protein [Gemmatimonadota bacterium]
MRHAVLAIGLTVALAAGSARTAHAQRLCRPTSDSHEAQLLAALAVPLAYGTVEAPAVPVPGAVRVALEVTYLPDVDEVIRTATQCRPGKGPEHTDLLFAFPRPRVMVGLPAGLLVEASWIPPVRLNGVQSHLVGLSVARGFVLGGRGSRLTLRAHSTFGRIRAAITCPDEELENTQSECFEGTRSDDRYHPTTFGAEGVLGWSLGEGRLRPFVGAGLNLLRPRFQVNFTDRFGTLDDTRVEVNLARGALFAGATWTVARGLGLSGEIYGAPGDAVTGRLLVSFALR